ncbi:MAG: ArnT family glycosyltransferase, partial [Tepidisphaeraceae bacterium]
MSDPTRRARHRIIAMIAIVGAVYLVGNGRVPLWDRDEPRYAQASRQMLHSGDWVVPRFLDKPRVNKPPLIYWLQAGSMKWLGETDFAARLPSVVAMVATLVVLGASVWCAAGPRRAAWTIFIFATCGMTLAAAKMAITDSVLLVWILGAQLCVYQIWRGRATWWTYAVLGLAVAFGGLAKGPVILGVMGMTLLALWGMRAIDRHRTGEQIREGEAPAEP